MKKYLVPCVAAGVFLMAQVVVAAPKVKMGHDRPEPVEVDAPPPVGSIRVKGKLRPSERMALAKISFAEAYKAAVIAHPGKVAYGELEVDDGNLVFDFLIINANRSATEVQVDAGNGKVLDVDEGDDE